MGTKEKEKDFVRTTIDLPIELNEKLYAEAETEHRSRHTQMLYVLEKYFEQSNGEKKSDKKGAKK